MKKIIFGIGILMIFLFSGCTDYGRGCPENTVLSDSCEFGTYSYILNRCEVTACRTDPANKIKGEGEMCAGFAGYRCRDGLYCKMEGNYPDAAGICLKRGDSICSKIGEPNPDFCPNGTISPKYEGGCMTGYSCKPAAMNADLDVFYNESCKSDSDCQVMDVGNCCGYYPRCLNKDSITDPEAVAENCAKKGLVSACGFPSVNSCACASGKCVGKE